jgi:hypothetical protein
VSETDPRESNPNAAGPEGLEGEMGVSSERTGPDGGSDPTDEGIEGTGTVGTARTGTDGEQSTSRRPADEVVTEPGSDETARSSPEGEEANTADVPCQDFDPSRNPGHSHG